MKAHWDNETTYSAPAGKHGRVIFRK